MPMKLCVSYCVAIALLAAATVPVSAQYRYSADLPENVQTTKEARDAVQAVAGSAELLLTKHYAVIYTGSLDSARARAEMLERGFNAFFTFMKQLRFELAPPTNKLTVLVFDDQEQFNAYRAKEQPHTHFGPGAILQGYYNPETNRAAFFNQVNSAAYRTTREAYEQIAAALVAIPGPPETQIMVTTAAGQQVTTKARAAADLKALANELDEHFAAENQQVTLHEGAHQLAFNTTLQSRTMQYPFWVSEGLACVFETPSSKSTFGPFRVNLMRLQMYKNARDAGRLRGVRQLVDGKLDGADLFELYAESWSLFYYLLRRKPNEFKAYLHALADRPPTRPGEDRGALELQVFAEHFGDDFEETQKNWSIYMDRLIRGNEDELK